MAGVLPADLQVVRAGLLYAIKRGWAVSWKNTEISEENVFVSCHQRRLIKLDNIRILEDAIGNEWQRRWDDSNKGRCTYRFINDVGGIGRAPWIDLNYRIKSFLSGHGFLRQILISLGWRRIRNVVVVLIRLLSIC